MVALDGMNAANACPDDHANAIGILFGDLQPSVLDGHGTRTQGILDEDIHFLDFFALDEIFWVEVLDLTSDLHRGLRGIEGGDPIDSRSAFADPFPGLLNAGAEWCNEPQAGHDHPPFHPLHRPILSCLGPRLWPPRRL